MAFCFQCGKQLPDGAAFCPGCGTRQVSVPQSAPQPDPQPVPESIPQPQPAPQPTPPSAAGAVKAGGSVLKWLLPLLAVVAVLAVAAYLYFGTNVFKSDEQMIRDRIQALEDAYNDGDYEGILDCMDNQTQIMMESTMGMMDGLVGDMGMGMGMSDMFGFASMFGDYCSIDIQSIEIDGDTANVTVTMSINLMGMHQSQETSLPMVKEDGDWYIGGTAGVTDSDYMNFLT